MGCTERKDKDSEENSPHNGKVPAANQATTGNGRILHSGV